MQMFLTFKKLHFFSLQWCLSLDFINEGFEEHEAECGDVTPLSQMRPFTSLHSVLRNSELQPRSCGKDPFESSRSLQPCPQAVRKPRSCRHLLMTNAADESCGSISEYSSKSIWSRIKQVPQTHTELIMKLRKTILCVRVVTVMQYQLSCEAADVICITGDGFRFTRAAAADAPDKSDVYKLP